MRLSFRALLVCWTLTLGVSAPAEGQATLLDPVTRAQGSPSDYVFDLLQDRTGFLWMATDAGLVRYDGRDFVTWTVSEGLPHNYVNVLHELPGGRIAVGTFRGAAILERGRLTRLRDTHGSVTGVAQDRFGRLYLASAAGIEVCTGLQCRVLLRTTPMGEGHFVAAPDGTLHLALFGNEIAVVRPSPQGVTVVRQAVTLPPEASQLVGIGAAGQRFFTLPDHLGVDDSVGRVQVRLPHTQLRTRYALPGGALLMGTEQGDVWRIGPDGATRIAGRADVGGYAVHAMLRDYEGHLWLGLFGGGVRRLDTGTMLLPGRTDPQLAHPILRLSRDRSGTVWMTTREGLFARTADGRVRKAGKGATMLVTDHPAGGHYVSSSTSLGWRRPNRRNSALLFDGNWVSSLLLGPGDTLWMGTYGSGLRRVVGSREVAPPVAGGPPVVEVLVAGAHGAIWALTRSEGAFRYAAGRWTNVGAGLPSGAVFSLLDEPEGTLYLGTDRGLVRRRGAMQRVFDDAGRLRGQRLHALFRIADTLWAVADRQLYALVGDSLHSFGRVRLRPNEDVAIHAAVGVPEQRRVLLGTSAGLVEVDLRALGDPLPAPRVAFLGLPEAGAAPQDTVRLARGQRSVTLAFAPLTFGGSPGRLQRRIAEGPWSAPTSERAVTLAGLADGWHVLDVRAVNAEGRPSAAPVRVVLYVPPPWWRTWPARGAGLIVLLGLAAFAARSISTRRLRARLRALETERRVQGERDRISRDLHDHVGAQLTGVLAGLELLGDEAPAASGLVAALRAEVRETMGALRTAIFTLQHPPASFDELGRLLDRYVRDQARFHPTPLLRCSVDGHLARPLHPPEAMHLFRIAQEGLQNAIRHARAGRVSVRLTGDGVTLTLVVSDDGQYRTHDGTGHGLAAMQARADEIGATLGVEGTADGTTVRVVWPGNIVRREDAVAEEAVVP